MSKSRSEEEGVGLQLDRIWKPVFDKYDCDNDGKIPLDEFKQMVHDTNVHLQEDIPPEVLDEILERADWDKDRYISYEEFMHMVSAREVAMHWPRVQRLVRYAAITVVPRCERNSTVRKYLQAHTCAPPPLFILLISLLELGIFIYYCVKLEDISATGPVPFKSPLIYNPHKRQEVWRYLTYMLIHAGIIHIFFNLLIQLILGIPLEMVHKFWRVGIVYFGGVVAGSLGASISDPFSYLAGASGGVYALISAHLASVVINWSEMEFNWLRLVALLAFAGTDIGVAMYDRYTQNPQNRTSYSAHLCGAIAGLLLGVVFLRNLKVRRWERILGWFALVVYVLVMGAAVIFNVADPEYFPKSDNE